MGRIVYGYWDCSQCGTKGIRGDNRECSNCGRPRSADTKFYMGENIEYIPADKEKNMNRNPDWLCPYCNALNSDSILECKGCGASRSESQKDYFDLSEKPKLTEQDIPKANIISTAVKFTEDNKIKVVLIVAAAILISFVCVFLFRTYDKEMTVTGFNWERSIEIETLITVNESGWNIPNEARMTSSAREFKEYKQVFDHNETKTRQVAKQRISGYETYISGYRDMGNGKFEEITAQRPIYETYYDTETYQEAVYRQEAVYAIKYYYEIDKWVFSRDVNTGGSDKSPQWAEYKLTDNERVSKEKEKYMIFLTDEKNKTYNYEVSYDIWDKLLLNDTVSAKTNVFGNVVSVEWTKESVEK